MSSKTKIVVATYERDHLYRYFSAFSRDPRILIFFMFGPGKNTSRLHRVRRNIYPRDLPDFRGAEHNTFDVEVTVSSDRSNP